VEESNTGEVLRDAYLSGEYSSNRNYNYKAKTINRKVTGAAVSYADCYIDELLLTEFQLNGTIPESFTNLTGLQILVLQANHLYSSIPSSINRFKSLKQAYLDGNRLSGSLPTTLGELSQLAFFSITDNRVSGTLPTELGGLSSLEFIDLSINNLGGSIPTELFSLTSVVHLFLPFNQLTGTLATELSAMTNLNYLSFAGNSISGTLPSLERLQGLNSLFGSSNLMEFSIPSTINMWSDQLYAISMQSNYISGDIPSSLTELTALIYLDLASNYIYGKIPANIGNLSNLNEILLYQNYMSSTLPPSITQLRTIETMMLQQNQFSGDLDTLFSVNASKVKDASNLYLLSTIDLSDNGFTGTLPAKLFSLPLIDSIALVKNCFHGSIPAEICDGVTNAQRLTVLDLDGLTSGTACQQPVFGGATSFFHSKAFTSAFMLGTIPSCLFQFPALRTLHLAGNGFQGTIPGEVEISGSLRNLSLSYNRLTGKIPTSIQTFPFKLLDLSYNRLTGTAEKMAALPLGSTTERQRLQRRLLSGESADAGTLLVDDEQYTNRSLVNDTVLDLQVNRLSGPMPHNFHEAHYINVVNGNLFGCQEQSQLPVYDPGTPTATCGSYVANLTFYGAIIAFAAMFLLVSLLICGKYCAYCGRTESLTVWSEYYFSQHEPAAGIVRSSSGGIGTAHADKSLEHHHHQHGVVNIVDSAAGGTNSDGGQRVSLVVVVPKQRPSILVNRPSQLEVSNRPSNSSYYTQAHKHTQSSTSITARLNSNDQESSGNGLQMNPLTSGLSKDLHNHDEVVVDIESPHPSSPAPTEQQEVNTPRSAPAPTNTHEDVITAVKTESLPHIPGLHTAPKRRTFPILEDHAFIKRLPLFARRLVLRYEHFKEYTESITLFQYWAVAHAVVESAPADLTETRMFLILLREFRRMFIVLGIYIAVVALPVFIGVQYADGEQYSTHTFQYAWTPSIMFTQGQIPTIALLLTSVMSSVLTLYFILVIDRKELEAPGGRKKYKHRIIEAHKKRHKDRQHAQERIIQQQQREMREQQERERALTLTNAPSSPASRNSNTTDTDSPPHRTSTSFFGRRTSSASTTMTNSLMFSPSDMSALSLSHSFLLSARSREATTEDANTLANTQTNSHSHSPDHSPNHSPNHSPRDDIVSGRYANATHKSTGWRDWCYRCLPHNYDDFRASLLLFIIFPIINIVVILTINALYLYITLTQDAKYIFPAQVMLLFIKLIWNLVILPTSLRLIRGRSTMFVRKLGVQMVLLIFNTVVAPLLAGMVSSPNCFKNIVSVAPSVDISLVYSICYAYSASGLCILRLRVPITSTFTPPFMYSYQCGSIIMTSYVPVFVEMYASLGIFYPLFMFVGAVLVNRNAQTQTQAQAPQNKQASGVGGMMKNCWKCFVSSIGQYADYLSQKQLMPGLLRLPDIEGAVNTTRTAADDHAETDRQTQSFKKGVNPEKRERLESVGMEMGPIRPSITFNESFNHEEAVRNPLANASGHPRAAGSAGAVASKSNSGQSRKGQDHDDYDPDSSLSRSYMLDDSTLGEDGSTGTHRDTLSYRQKQRSKHSNHSNSTTNANNTSNNIVPTKRSSKHASHNNSRHRSTNLSRTQVLLNTGAIISHLICHLTVLLTFGSTFPPLGIIIVVSLCVITSMWEVLVGRYLFHILQETVPNAQRMKLTDTLERSCVGVRRRLFNKVKWVIITMKAIFYCLFAVDMTEPTSSHAIGVWIVYPCLFAVYPLAMWAGVRLFNVSNKKFAQVVRRNTKQELQDILSGGHTKKTDAESSTIENTSDRGNEDATVRNTMINTLMSVNAADDDKKHPVASTTATGPSGKKRASVSIAVPEQNRHEDDDDDDDDDDDMESAEDDEDDDDDDDEEDASETNDGYSIKRGNNEDADIDD
jgi:Leucine-rich repeat (LRR) protein